MIFLSGVVAGIVIGIIVVAVYAMCAVAQKADERADRMSDLVTLFAEDVVLDFTPAAGDPAINFGGSPLGGGTGVRVGNDSTGNIFNGWGGSAGQFAIGRHGEIFILPDFFVVIKIPSVEKLGLPDWLPVEITELGIRFNDGALGPGTGEYSNSTVIVDPLAFTLIVSGGIVPGPDLPFPIAASLDGLQIDISLLAAGQFPIVGLTGFSVGVGPVTFGGAGGMEIYGELSIHKITVDADAGPGVSEQTAFYVRVAGKFLYSGIGAV